MGCHTEPAAVHIAHVLQRLHFFQFFNFFIIYTTYRKKKLHTLTAKKNNSILFYNLHDLPQKKNYTHLPQKKITRFFFRTRLTFFTYILCNTA